MSQKRLPRLTGPFRPRGILPVLQVWTGSPGGINNSRADLEKEDTMIDLYTKMVLTVIAAALVGSGPAGNAGSDSSACKHLRPGG